MQQIAGVLMLFLLAFLMATAPRARAGQPEAPPAAPPSVPSPMPRLIEPHEMLDVSEIRPGMQGNGLSVFEGTGIERFNVTVLGVLRKIDYDGDLILVRITGGYPVTSGSGVSAGMSGSPIYIDGRLIGALAFAWPFAREPIAGVTPIAQMLENYRPGSSPRNGAPLASGELEPAHGPLKLDGRLFARARVVPEAGLAVAATPGTLYLAPVATPVLVSGMGRAALDEVRARLSRYPMHVAAGPGRTDLPANEQPRLEPGAAVGVQLLGGDIDATAIGTVTWVRGDHVIAFGHPMFGLGTIDMPMTSAFVHGIISSQEISFKLGSPVQTVGSIEQDRNWSIGGRLGKPAPGVEAQFSVHDRARGIHRDYKVTSAVHRDLTRFLLYSALLNAVNAVTPASEGTTRATLEIEAEGMPTIRRENLFSAGERRSAFEELFGDPLAGLPLGEMLQIMDLLQNNAFGPVPVRRVRVQVDVSEARSLARIERAYADRKTVRPGERVKVGMVIQPQNGPAETREFEVEVPGNIPGGRLQIGVAGGTGAERLRNTLQLSRPPAETLPQLVAQVAEREQNNHLSILVAQPVFGFAVSGQEFPNLPNVVVEVLTGANPTGVRAIRSHTSTRHALPWVLSGAHVLTLQVEAEEKDKAGALPAGGAGGAGFGSLIDLFRQGLTGEAGEFGDAEEDGEVRAPRGRRRTAVQTRADEPAMPSFDELQRLLEEAGGADSPGGAAGDPAARRPGSAGVWRHAMREEFARGRLEGVLISSEGELAPAPPAVPLLTSPDQFFWAQAADRAGNVYVGGWLNGTIQKIDPQGNAAAFFSPPGAPFPRSRATRTAPSTRPPSRRGLSTASRRTGRGRRLRACRENEYGRS
jgi:hypothetical protein